MPEISVIVPVYNVEEYLARCIDSILAQSFTDFELILVDDGSTDSSGVICDEYAEGDSRVHVIHQVNKGQAAARNCALDLARGEYVSFIDSDDYVHPEMLCFLTGLAETTNADICIYKYLEGKDSSYKWEKPCNDFIVAKGSDFLRKCILNDVNRCWILCDKLFKRKCFNSIRLPEGRIHEDNATVYKLLYDAEKVVINDSILYYYYENPNSTMNESYSLKRLDWLLVLEEMIPFFVNHNEKELLDWANRFYLKSLYDSYMSLKKYYPGSFQLKNIKKKLIKQYQFEKQRYTLNIKTHPYLINEIHPHYSRWYWTYIGIKNKFSKREK